MDAALSKKNSKYIDLKWVGGDDWKGWTDGLSGYYRDPPPGSILINHEFVFGDSDLPTKFKRKEYRDSAEVEEYDLLPTSRSNKICVGLSAEDRADDLQVLPDCLDVLPPPGLSADKANECQNKLRRLAPDDSKDYYNRMTRELQEEMDAKAVAKNKARNDKNKSKQAKIAAANKNNR